MISYKESRLLVILKLAYFDVMVHANFPITIPIDFRLAYWNCAVCRPEEHDIELRTTPPPGHRMYGEISNHEVRMNVILIGLEMTKSRNAIIVFQIVEKSIPLTPSNPT